MVFLYHANKRAFYEIVHQVTIGRTSGEVVCGDDGRMSGTHARFSVELKNDIQFVFVEDLGSKNHTAVNRVEIEPNEKFQVKMSGLVEIGDQRFVLTESKLINAQQVDEMIEMLLKKALVKLEPDKPSPRILNAAETTTFELIKKKETRIAQIQIEIEALEENSNKEIAKLEEAKEKILAHLKVKLNDLSNIMTVLAHEVEEKKIEIAKIRAEVELKKKKIINLNDIPSHPVEDLPE